MKSATTAATKPPTIGPTYGMMLVTPAMTPIMPANGTPMIDIVTPVSTPTISAMSVCPRMKPPTTTLMRSTSSWASGRTLGGSERMSPALTLGRELSSRNPMTNPVKIETTPVSIAPPAEMIPSAATPEKSASHAARLSLDLMSGLANPIGQRERIVLRLRLGDEIRGAPVVDGEELGEERELSARALGLPR